MFLNNGEPAYITKRFDRFQGGGKRLQEDFAQLSERSEESHGRGYKYEGSYEEIAQLMKEFIAPYAIEVEKFFDIEIARASSINSCLRFAEYSLPYYK